MSTSPDAPLRAASNFSSSSASASSDDGIELGEIRKDVGGDEEGQTKHYPWDKKPNLFRKLFCFDICGVPYLVQVVMAATCTGSFLFGFNLSLFNTLIGTVGAEFLWCGYEGYTGCSEYQIKSASIQSAVFIGAAIGSISGGRFLVYGTGRVLNAAMGLILLGIAFSCASNAFTSLLLARVVVGVAVGVLSVVCPTYIAEMTPPDKRGSYGVTHQLFITVGIFVGVLLGLPLSSFPEVADGAVEPTVEQMTWTLSDFDRVWWRVMLGIGALPVLLAIYVFNFVFTAPTPYYLISNGRYGEARQLLRKLTDKQDVTVELRDIEETLDKSRRARENGLTLVSIMKDRRAIYVIFVGCTISAFQQFSGINVFITSSNKLFSDAGLDTDLVTVMSTVLTLVNVIMTLPSIYLIERIGRRTLVLIGVLGAALSVVPGGIMLWIDEDSDATSWVAIAGAIGFIIFFAISYGPVLWVYLFEIFPSEMKDVAGGLATAVNWIAGIAMVFAASFMATHIAYTVFFAFCVVAFVFILLTMKETKGRVVGDSPYFADRHPVSPVAAKEAP